MARLPESVAPPSETKRSGDLREDEVAWWPLRPGGFRFATQRTVVRRGRLDLETSLLTRSISILLAVPGLAVVGLLAWRGHRLDLEAFSVLGLFAATWLFLAAVYFRTVPTAQFDRSRREIRRARLPFVAPARRVGFDELRALQILREKCTTRAGGFYSYELNLVLRDGRRVNVADHGDLAHLRESARRLRAFLRVPIWDGAEADAPERPRTRAEDVKLGVALLIFGAASGAWFVWVAIVARFDPGDTGVAEGAFGQLLWLGEQGAYGIVAVSFLAAGVERLRRTRR